MAASFYNERKSEGLELWVVLGETMEGGEPDLDYCMAYAESHGMNPENLYIDYNSGSVNPAWDTLFTHIAAGTTSIGLPWQAVVEGIEMTYLWNNVEPGGPSGEQVIEELLAN